jgi:hypothetical protein
LGSGGSINELNQLQWQGIEDGFSVGMNKWLIHDFIPDATSLEKNWHKSLYENLYNDPRLENSRFKYLLYPHSDITQNKGFPFDFPVEILNKLRLHAGARNIVSTFEQLNRFHSDKNYFKLIERKLSSGLNYEQKGSVYRLVQFALASGYRHIVFCGIDLNSVAYFWDKGDFLQNRGIYTNNFNEQKGKIHATEIKSEESLPMSEVIQSLQNGLKGKVRFETSSSHSKLAEFLSVWNPQK